MDDVHGAGFDFVPSPPPTDVDRDCDFITVAQWGGDPLWLLPPGDPYDLQGPVPRAQSPNDPGGHGTQTAAVVGAVGNNASSVCGTAWTVKIMSLRVMNRCQDMYYSNWVMAVDYAVKKHARVINASLGMSEPLYSPPPSMLRAIELADASGVLFVCAAGNLRHDIDVPGQRFYPAAYSGPPWSRKNMVVVAGTNQQDELFVFGQSVGSNWGVSSVDLGAPGVNIQGLLPGSSWSGTSEASPIVAGAAALVWAQFPAMTPAEVKERLLCSVRVVPALIGKVRTGGILDVNAAIRGILTNCN